MPAIRMRRVTQSGGSLMTPLPRDWCAAFGLDKGSEIRQIYNSVVIITPPNTDFDLSDILEDLQILKLRGVEKRL